MAIDRCLFDDAASGNEVIDVGEGGVGLHGMIDNVTKGNNAMKNPGGLSTERAHVGKGSSDGTMAFCNDGSGGGNNPHKSTTILMASIRYNVNGIAD